MRTFVPGANMADCPPKTSSSPTMQLFRPMFSSCSLPSVARTTACCRETSGLCRQTRFEGSRPIVITGSVDLDHRAAAFVDFVEPNLHGETTYSPPFAGADGCPRRGNSPRSSRSHKVCASSCRSPLAFTWTAMVITFSWTCGIWAARITSELPRRLPSDRTRKGPIVRVGPVGAGEASGTGVNQSAARIGHATAGVGCEDEPPAWAPPR